MSEQFLTQGAGISFCMPLKKVCVQAPNGTRQIKPIPASATKIGYKLLDTYRVIYEYTGMHDADGLEIWAVTKTEPL